MTPPETFPYSGPEALRAPVEAALRGIVDPEMSLNIVDLGLVYGVDLRPAAAAVTLTMTSAACPVAELIVDEVVHALQSALGEGVAVDVRLVWEPPWTPERMSPAARSAMGWE